jgi:hypothetical protein
MQLINIIPGGGTDIVFDSGTVLDDVNNDDDIDNFINTCSVSNECRV